MTNSTALRKMIARSGLTYEFIASSLDITVSCLKNKINNDCEFVGSEISLLAELLNLSRWQRNYIFFPR